MTEAAYAVGAAVGSGLMFGLVQALRDWRDGKAVFKKNGTAESNTTIQKILKSQEELKLHYNEDTTAVLKEMLQEMRDHNRMETEVHQLLGEFKEYGIKTRE